MTGYTQTDVANIVGVDHRLLRTFVDAGMVIPSDETRTRGRGAAKLFQPHELRIVDVLHRLHSYGFTRDALLGVSRCLRSELLLQHHSKQGRWDYAAIWREAQNNQLTWRARVFQTGSERLCVPSEFTATSLPAEFFFIRIREFYASEVS